MHRGEGGEVEAERENEVWVNANTKIESYASAWFVFFSCFFVSLPCFLSLTAYFYLVKLESAEHFAVWNRWIWQPWEETVKGPANLKRKYKGSALGAPMFEKSLWKCPLGCPYGRWNMMKCHLGCPSSGQDVVKCTAGNQSSALSIHTPYKL